MKDGQLLGQANWGRARCLRHELLSSSGWIRNYKFGRAARATNGGNQYPTSQPGAPRRISYCQSITTETARASRNGLVRFSGWPSRQNASTLRAAFRPAPPMHLAAWHQGEPAKLAFIAPDFQITKFRNYTITNFL